MAWRAETENIIVARFDLPPEQPEVRVRIDEHGAIRTVTGMRWGNAGQKPFQYIPFGGEIHAERRFGELVLPSRASVGWWFATPRYAPFFHAEISDVTPTPSAASRTPPRWLPREPKPGSLPRDDARHKHAARGRATAGRSRGRPVLVAPRSRWPLRATQRPRVRGGDGARCAATGVRPVPLRPSKSVLGRHGSSSSRRRSVTPRDGQCGVVAEGPVGARWAGRFRIFGNPNRRWRDGRIPDIDEAVGSPLRLTDDEAHAQLVLDLVPQVPTPTWGRDELKTGAMWNSNSVIAWLLTRSGIDTTSIHAPRAGGRAPGWHAGLVVARRQEAEMPPTPLPAELTNADRDDARSIRDG